MEWVLALFLGTAHTSGAPLTIDQPAVGTSLTLDPVSYRGESFSPPLYYGFRVAGFASPGFGLEAEMIHLKVYARTELDAEASGVHRNRTVAGRMPVNSILEQFSISHGLNMVLFNAVARRTLRPGAGAVRITGRAGAGPTIPHPESRIDGESHSGYEPGAVAFQVGAGVEVQLTRQFSAMAEYKFTRSTQAISVDRGVARSAFGSHHAVVGLAWHSQ